LKRRWEKEPITYHFRRFAINRWNIPKSNDVTSHSFFSGENPTRVYMCIAKTEDLTGNKKTTPYLFARKWEIPVNFGDLRQSQTPNWLQGLIQNSLADQLREIRELIPLAVLRASQEQQQPQPREERGRASRSSRSRGRGTSVRGRGNGGIQGVAAAATGFVGRLLNRDADQVSLLADVDEADQNEEFVEAGTASAAPSVAGSSSSARSIRSRMSLGSNVSAATETLYLTKCQLQLNSSDLGNFIE